MYYKLGQSVLQIGAGIINQGNYYKLGHNIDNLAGISWILFFLFKLLISFFSVLSQLLHLLPTDKKMSRMNVDKNWIVIIES